MTWLTCRMCPPTAHSTCFLYSSVRVKQSLPPPAPTAVTVPLPAKSTPLTLTFFVLSSTHAPSHLHSTYLRMLTFPEHTLFSDSQPLLKLFHSSPGPFHSPPPPEIPPVHQMPSPPSEPTSRRGLTPRGSLECNPEIPAFPGEEN